MIDINKILPEQIKTDMPEFNPGDHIRVQVRVVEGDKERLQSFEKYSRNRRLFSKCNFGRMWQFTSL